MKFSPPKKLSNLVSVEMQSISNIALSSNDIFAANGDGKLGKN